MCLQSIEIIFNDLNSTKRFITDMFWLRMYDISQGPGYCPDIQSWKVPKVSEFLGNGSPKSYWKGILISNSDESRAYFLSTWKNSMWTAKRSLVLIWTRQGTDGTRISSTELGRTFYRLIVPFKLLLPPLKLVTVWQTNSSNWSMSNCTPSPVFKVLHSLNVKICGNCNIKAKSNEQLQRKRERNFHLRNPY